MRDDYSRGRCAAWLPLDPEEFSRNVPPRNRDRASWNPDAGEFRWKRGKTAINDRSSNEQPARAHVEHSRFYRTARLRRAARMVVKV